MAFGPGETFDRYRIESLIGQGGMGRVYAAVDTRLHRRVALKVVLKEPSLGTTGPQDAGARLMREARAAAALDHPNAVSVFDVGEVGETLYIAMELVTGKTLRAYVGDASVPWEVKLKWLLDAARALAAAHDRGLVHRDIKPENVMVRDDGVVKVLDFGIAKRMSPELEAVIQQNSDETGADGTPTAQTAGGIVLGTPRYFSPEQVRGEAVDGRADQFAWGVVAYELLSGTLPWREDATGLQLLMAILTKAPEALGQRAPELPSLVEATVMKTLAKAPADRFASMHFVVSTLEQFVTSSRRSLADIAHPFETFKTEPAPPMADSGRSVQIPVPAPVPKLPVIEHVTGDPSLPAAAASIRPAPWRRFGLAAVTVVSLAAAVVMALLLRARETTPAPSAASASAATAAPTAITDLAPPSVAPEARAAFLAFAQSFRDGDFDSARQSLLRATAVEPSLAAAYVRLAFLDSLVSADEADVGRSFRKAVQYRASLSPRDEALLEAFEPYFQSEPSDPAECERRLSRVADAYPMDAELAYYLGSVRFDRGELEQAVAAFDRASAIDPKFAQAFASKAGCQAYLGDAAGALASIDHCLAVSGSATECLWYRAQIHEQSGACAEMEADTHQWISKDEGDWLAYQWLAKALYAEGKPLDVVRAALEQKWVRVEAPRRARLEALDRIRLDLAAGDFASAERRLVQLEGDLAVEPGALAHAESHKLLVEVYREEGRDADARRIAESFLARRDAWLTPHRVDDRAIWEDAVPTMLAALVHARAMPEETFLERRGAWLSAWRAKTSGAYTSFLWIYGYALPADDAAAARAALAARADFPPLPPFTPQSIAAAHVGKAYLLAGQVDDAARELRRATGTCIALYEPVAHTRPHLHLGMALEAKGDTRGACDAYAVVRRRWGAAKPSSTTAREAEARASALHCPRL